MKFSPRGNPRLWFALWGGVPAVGLALALGWWLAWGFWWVYLLGINLSTISLYFYDKTAAKREWLRVPEVVLHGFAFVGGTPAAFVGQKWMRHKTQHVWFLVISWAIFAAQVALLLLWLIYFRSPASTPATSFIPVAATLVV